MGTCDPVSPTQTQEPQVCHSVDYWALNAQEELIYTLLILSCPEHIPAVGNAAFQFTNFVNIQSFVPQSPSTLGTL